MPVPPIDTTEMFAVHDCFRAEFGALPGQITAVADGDVGRARVVGEHVMMMTMMLHSHHGSEDLLMWPVLTEQVPEQLELIQRMEGQHQRMSELLDGVQAATPPWMESGSASEGASLASTLSELSDLLTEHLAAEETEIMPIVSTTFTHEQFAAIGAHSREHVPPELLGIGLGIILSDTTPERGEAILAFMPPEARDGFEQFGRPAYAAYRERLLSA